MQPKNSFGRAYGMRIFCQPGTSVQFSPTEPVESSSPTEPVTYKSIKIAKFKKLDYYYESTVPCTEVAFLKSYAGMPNIGLFIDNILDIHKQEIEETKSLGFIVLKKVYKCTYWGLGVEYALDKQSIVLEF